VNEALTVARHRSAFDRTIIDYPLLRRQLMKLIVPTEQALSMAFAAADAMGRAQGGSAEAEAELRILTPLLKLRACRDNVPVATGSMEVRGGNGYIEDWVNARLVRDAQVGLLWEGTSNINALDVITRAVGKAQGHRALQALLRRRLGNASPLPDAFRGRLETALDRAVTLAESVAATRTACRRATRWRWRMRRARKRRSRCCCRRRK
jgi:acyl-CoA dehydrogenase